VEKLHTAESNSFRNWLPSNAYDLHVCWLKFDWQHHREQFCFCIHSGYRLCLAKTASTFHSCFDWNKTVLKMFGFSFFLSFVQFYFNYAYSIREIYRGVSCRKKPVVRWQGPISVHCSPYKVFLLFLYLWDVLFKNLNDATLASLGNPRNMQIKAAITENLVFSNISVIIHGTKIILVSIPIFCGVKNQIKPF